MLNLIILGFEGVWHFNILLSMCLGVIAGIIAGSIPGFTITMAIVLTLPFTFAMTPIWGMATMVGVYIGGLSGGLISAILLGIPGTPSAVATTFDGYPMAIKKGKPGEALMIGISASFLGSLIGMVVLVTLAPQVANIALKFGPWEYFSLIIFALTIIASVTGDSIIKGLLTGVFGLLISTVGTDPMTGFHRFTFGIISLRAGLPFLTVLIGIFAVSRLFTELEAKKEGVENKKLVVSEVKVNLFGGIKKVLSQPFNLIRSSLLGVLIGAIPGAGASISNILAYDQAKKGSKYPEKFGTGIADGIIASESANNGTAGGGLIPMMAMGIPGSAVTAVMLGALMVHGIHPGPLLITNHPEVAGGIFVSYFLASIFMFFVQAWGVNLFVKVISIPKFILVPVVLSLCIIGSYVLNNRLSDLYILFFLGIIGYFLIKNKFALAPIILGCILGPIAETNLRRAMMISYDWSLFFTRPISLGFLIVGAFSIFYSIRQKNKQRYRENLKKVE